MLYNMQYCKLCRKTYIDSFKWFTFGKLILKTAHSENTKTITSLSSFEKFKIKYEIIVFKQFITRFFICHSCSQTNHKIWHFSVRKYFKLQIFDFVLFIVMIWKNWIITLRNYIVLKLNIRSKYFTKYQTKRE